VACCCFWAEYSLAQADSRVFILLATTMMSSRSAPSLAGFLGEEQGKKAQSGSQGSFSRLSDSSDGKDAGVACRAGDTRLGEMFIRDRLTSGQGLAKASPLANLMPQQNQKPLSKYDHSTGKFYRSLVVDASSIPSSLSAIDLLQIFSSDEELAYRSETHTGAIVSLAGGSLTLTCVGETHVDADKMYANVQDRLCELLFPEDYSLPVEGEEAVVAETAAGISLFNAGKGPAEKDCDLVAESMAGMSLFSSAQPKQARPVVADTCGGMTMFSFEEADSELSGNETEDEEEFQQRPSVLAGVTKILADTVAGMTFFSRKEQDAEALNATETSGGMTLYLGDGKRMQNVVAETCCGMTTFSECSASPDACSNCDDCAPCCVAASDSMMGYTDFTPLLKSIQQDPESYTEEQKWMSDLAWGVC